MKEYILCAAIWYKDQLPAFHNCKNIKKGVVLCGHRHSHIISQHKALLNKSAYEMGEYEQGFLTSTNRFVDRKEAMIIAENAFQLLEPKIREELYSEDLY